MARQDEVEVKGAPGAKRTCGQRINAFINALWDPNKKQLFGRGGCSWAKIALFYLIFYSCLAGFFAIMMAGFFATLDDKKPSMTGMYSLIKGNPGMGFRPRRNVESTLIKFKAVPKGGEKEGDYDDLVNNMMNFLKEGKYIEEDGDKWKARAGNETTGLKQYNIEEALAACPLDDFGYKDGKPCVILKLNKVFGWEPRFDAAQDDWYNNTKKVLGDRGPDMDNVGVSCEGENDGDIDNMGPVEFFPSLGFNKYYYPYDNDDMYRAPIVFAKFQKPIRGVVMQIWCKAWARNIKHHKNDKGGSTHFELFVGGPEVREDTTQSN